MEYKGIYAVRSHRTVDAFINVFKPMIWNAPLAIVVFVTAVLTRPTIHDTIPLVIMGLCFIGMFIFTTIGASRLPALGRSERLDKENLKKGLRPDGTQP